MLTSSLPLPAQLPHFLGRTQAQQSEWRITSIQRFIFNGFEYCWRWQLGENSTVRGKIGVGRVRATLLISTQSESLAFANLYEWGLVKWWLWMWIWPDCESSAAWPPQPPRPHPHQPPPSNSYNISFPSPRTLVVVLNGCLISFGCGPASGQTAGKQLVPDCLLGQAAQT